MKGIITKLMTMMLLIGALLAGCSSGASVAEPAELSTGRSITFTMTGENFKFLMDGKDNPDLKVKVGDTVKIIFTSTDGFHDWVVTELNAATQKVKAGETATVEFVADKAGTFEYFCSVGSHRAKGMKGKL